MTDTRKYELRYSEEGQEFTANDEGVVEGYPVVFDKPATIYCYDGTFTEYIDRGALDATNLQDVQFLVNHNGQGITMARSRRNNENSTMQLEVDEIGLHMRARLDIENNAEARALHSAIKRGDISGMSFRFQVESEEWEGLKTDNPIRHIKAVKYIREISAVNEPAYPDTSISARSQDCGVDALEKARSVEDSNGAKALELAKAKNKIYFQ